MRGSHPIKLAGVWQKVAYFVIPDGREEDNVLDVDTVCYYSSIQNQIYFMFHLVGPQ